MQLNTNKPTWKDYLIATMATLMILVGAFYAKLYFPGLAETQVSIVGRFALMGAVVGAVVVLLCYLFRKLKWTIGLTIGLLILWLLLPDQSFVCGLYFGGAVCGLGSIPVTATLFARSTGKG